MFRSHWMEACLTAALLTAAPGKAAPAAGAPVRAAALRCEYRRNPLGIDVLQPRLSWVLEAADPAARGKKQTAYRILVASTTALLTSGRGDLWDTGKVSSDQSIQVVYGGTPLTSRQQVYWKVRLWDEGGAASAWSEPAQWTMGLLNAGDWKGKWIGLDGGEAKPEELRESRWIWPAADGTGMRYLRRTFANAVDNPASNAQLMLVSSAEATVFVNGVQVGKSEGLKSPVSVDITSRLRRGANTLAVAARAGAQGPSGILATLEMERPHGEPLVIRTDDQWRGSGTAPEAWLKPDFDASSWQAAKVLGSYGQAPWGEAGYRERRALPARYLRQDFQVPRQVRRATAYVSGLGLFELYLNGRKVGNDALVPALSEYDKRVFYLTYDVTSLLRGGPNAVGVILGNGRYFAPRLQVPIATRTFGYPKLRMQIEIEYTDGASAIVASDENWRITVQGPIRANNEYDGETYDARLEMSGWDRAGFRGDHWQAAQIVEPPAGAMAAQMNEPIQALETLEPLKITQPRPGAFIFDLGQNLVGWCRLKVAGPAGTRVTLRHAETLRPDGTLYVDNLRSARATDVYTLKGQGTEVWEPRFVYHGFRYVEVTGFPGAPGRSAITGRAVHDAVGQIADFTTSNPLLNRIHTNIVWGTKDNYRSIPTDCPQRDERQGWLGDRSSSSKGETYLFDVAALHEKWVGDMADSQNAEGSITDVAPAYWRWYSDNVTWPASFIIVPGNLYDQYADTRILQIHYDGMQRWVNRMRSYIRDGVMPRDTYGDWCVPPESPELIHSQDPARRTAGPLLGTAYFYEILTLMARYATILGKPGEAAAFEEQAASMKAAFNRKFFDPQSARYDNGSQTSSILPLAFGLVPDQRRQDVFQALVRKIAEQNQGHVGTGLIGAQWLMRVLSDNGRPDLAYQIAAQTTYPSWGYMVGQGATTIWELWNGNTADPAMNSGNHLMLVGDLNIWFYENLAGIRSDPERPGFQHIIMRPSPVGNLTFVKASHQSPYGRIASAWQRDGSRFTWTITIPGNATATVFVPARDASAVTESGTAAAQSHGVRFVRMDAGAAVYELGSGSYRFVSPL